MKLLTQVFTDLQDTVLKNVANSLLQLHFHQEATDEELAKYYGGAVVDREALIEDTRGRLEAEQDMLRFLQANLPKLKILYGTKNPTGDLGLPPRPGARNIPQPGSVDSDARGDGEDRPKEDTDKQA